MIYLFSNAFLPAFFVFRPRHNSTYFYYFVIVRSPNSYNVIVFTLGLELLTSRARLLTRERDVSQNLRTKTEKFTVIKVIHNAWKVINNCNDLLTNRFAFSKLHAVLREEEWKRKRREFFGPGEMKMD
jgi:hypothetical protein